MALTTLDPPVAAVISVWTQQCYGKQMKAALDLLAGECEEPRPWSTRVLAHQV